MRAPSKSGRVKKFFKEQVILIALLVVFLIFSILSRQFHSKANIILIFRQVATIAVMGCGMTFVIIGGNFDLSVGSLLSLCCVTCIMLHDKIGPIPAMAVTVLVGIGSGIVTGFLVGNLGLNSMIVTLGMMNVLQALTLIMSGGKYSNLADDSVWFTQIGKGSLGIVPISTIIMVVVIVAYTILLKYTVFGQHTLSVGTNPEACEYSGINDKQVISITFILSGLSAAIGAILLCSRGGAAQNTMGAGYEFDVITGVILGGANISGGSGSIVNTFIGVMIIGILKNGFVILGLPYYLQWIVQCVIILAAVWFDIRSESRGVSEYA